MPAPTVVEMAAPFPLDGAQCQALRASLQERVFSIHHEEVRLREELRQLPRATKAA